MKITTHLLTKNNHDTIEQAIQSVLPLGGEIIVGDWGSEDNTVELCRKNGAKVYEVEPRNNFSSARNMMLAMSDTPWQFYIEPWEMLAAGHAAIINVSEPKIYSIQVLQGDFITKETRLWNKIHNLQFMQPVYETLNNTTEEELSGVVIYSHPHKQDAKQLLDIIAKWMLTHPLAKEPHYYRAFTHLALGQYQQFIVAAEEYLFREKSGMPAIMMQYYLALVRLHLGSTQAAVRGVVSCICTKPLMAEFWCLLGDIYYKSNQYRKAIYYYENAIVLGRKRLKTDRWPLEISKYKKYPTHMIESCKKMLTNTTHLTRLPPR